MKFFVGLICCLSMSLHYSFGEETGDLDDVRAAIRNIATKVNSLEEELRMMKISSAIQQETIAKLEKSQKMTGEVAFTAFDSSGDTTYNAGDIIQFRNVLFDQGNHYDPFTGQYTCPVSGIYLFSLYSVCASQGVCNACIVVGGTDTAGYHINTTNTSGKAGSALVITQCNEGEVAYIKAKTSGTTVIGRLSENWTHGFSGVLLSYSS